MRSVRATAGNPAYYPTSTGEKPDINEIIQQLATAAAPVQDEVLTPVTEAWDALLELEATALGMTHEHKSRVESMLSEALRAAAYESPDVLLLKDVIHGVLGLARFSQEEYLAGRAYEGLCLPNLRLREIDEVEPNSRTFNSVLPSFAENTYDYGALGRTLLWKGACQLFAGPSNAERSDKLRQVIFSFSNLPKPGEEKLDQPWEFVMAVDELGLDEPVDVESLRQQQNPRIDKAPQEDQRDAVRKSSSGDTATS